MNALLPAAALEVSELSTRSGLGQHTTVTARLFDLPGGARDGDESEPEAVVREFREETGLRVAADVCLTEAAQFVDKSDGRTVNNTGGFWTLRLLEPTPSGKIEDDHELVWLDLVEALASLRHEAHAWAVAVWLRSRTSA